MFKFMFKVKTSGRSKTWFDAYGLHGQQFPCILCIVSTKSLFSSRGLYNVHEKSLLKGECELNY